MKSKLIGFIIVAILATACGNTKKDSEGSLNDKKAQLEKLKSEQKKINEDIAKLESDIKKADPTAIVTNAKLVSVLPLATTDFSHYIELQGRVDAQNISYVAPPNGQGGIVKALYVTQGQSVRKGQVLARLDDQMIRQQIEPLRVQLASAEDTYRRTKSLWDQGIGTYQQVLSAKTQMESLSKQIGVIQKQASLMTVTAPSSGIADQVNVRVGEMFVGATQAGPQIRIVNTSNLKVVASVPENYLGRVKVGSRIQIVLPEQNNRVIEAVVNVVQKVIDPNTRSFNIEAKIPADASLKPNQVAQIRILDYSAKDVIAIPLNVVQSDENGKYVYVMEKSGDKMIAKKKTVTVGESYADLIEIKSGLAQGEQLITEGYQNLYDGQVIATVAVKPAQ
ncbi:efflux RND transporter periplasmic adaptor subunit [Flavisolibacter ginsengisoli]|uniref:RND family efflux transporter, MFP subunit n=1 Tax=Flavisolibacter ginsengisoli DSM 18119 TaxID=1121884 RepID=A0A1M4VKT9_9BACT|nr:efflux RND transporter periplasmic adaptor subunit [Flavisolibacter ginsengisoli]SHE69497.1 RND family efflux transporter, MFP subunit [Flavisolibacter ginsengisoli DSM 18119]